MKHLLEVTHLQKQLGDFCLQDITFFSGTRVITGLVGRNGCGKTSLIKTILNLYEKDSGQIFVNGHSMESEEIAAKDQLGVVLDECLFDADTKAGDQCPLLRRSVQPLRSQPVFGILQTV